MAGFTDILNRGKKIFKLKDTGGKWGRCEDCDARAPLFPYEDKDHQTWMFCEKCLNSYMKED